MASKLQQVKEMILALNLQSLPKKTKIKKSSDQTKPKQKPARS